MNLITSVVRGVFWDIPKAIICYAKGDIEDDEFIPGIDNLVGFLQEESVMAAGSITNPNSIYVSTKVSFKGYRPYSLDAFVDTGATMSVAHKNAIPPEYWVNAKRPIRIQTAGTDRPVLDKVCKGLPVLISGYEFLIPSVYQQTTTNIDLILGNNFLQSPRRPSKHQKSYRSFGVSILSLRLRLEV